MSRKASTLQLEHRTGASRCTQRQNRTPKHVRQGIMCRSRRSRPDPSFCGSYARGSRTGFRAQKRIFPASRQPRRTLRDHRRTVLTKICILSTSRLPFRGPAAKLTAPGKSMQAPFLCNFELLEGYPKVESTNLAFCNCRKKSQNARRGSCVIAPCIGGRAGRGRDVPVRPQKPHQRAPRRRRASAARGFRRCSTLRGPSTLARGETVRCAPARAPCAQGPGR
jgi:hypothetical protein